MVSEVHSSKNMKISDRLISLKKAINKTTTTSKNESDT